MFIDALLRISNAQAITADAVSTSSIDFGVVSPDREIGTGEPMGFAMAVGVAADYTTTDETYTFEVVQDDDVALGSPTVVASYTRLASQLTAGSLHFFPLPQGFPTERYGGMNYNVGGNTPTITVTTWLTSHALFSLAPKAYPKNYAV